MIGSERKSLMAPLASSAVIAADRSRPALRVPDRRFGDVYACTTASLPFLFALADDPAAPDCASVVDVLLSIGRDEDPLNDAMTAIASFPTIVGAYARLLRGEHPVPVREDLSHAGHYFHPLFGLEPSSEQVRALETCATTGSMHPPLPRG